MRKIAVVIDSHHLRNIATANGFHVDYRRLKETIAERGSLMRAYYLQMIDESQVDRSHRPLLDWLDYNGYAPIGIQGKDSVVFAEQFILTAMAAAEWCSEIILVAGRYPALVKALMQKGVHVAVLSDIRVAEDAVRRAADEFIEIKEWMPSIVLERK